MDGKKVTVENRINAIVGVNLPELRFSRTWRQKGAKIPIDVEILKEAIYDPGVEYMLKNEILFIDDKDTRVELELEEPDKEKVHLTDSQRRRYLTTAPNQELEELLPQLSQVEIEALIEFAIREEAITVEKNDIIKRYTGKDILYSIQMKRQKEEE